MKASVTLPKELFYQTLSERSGFSVADDGDLMNLLTELAGIKTEYDKVRGALRDVRETGYGIVSPSIDELKLEEPEIVKQGGRYGVRLKASAPSIHMIRADIETSVSPVIGNEKQSEEMMNYLLEEFAGIPARSGRATFSGGPSMSWSARTCRASSNACRRMPGKSCRKHCSASSTKAAAA